MIVRIIRNLQILPRWVIIIIDLFIISSSVVLGYLLRFNFDFHEIVRNNYQGGVLLFVVCGLISIITTNSYKGIVRYTGLEDGIRIFYMISLNSILVCLFNLVIFYNNKFNIIPYSVVFITLLSSFLFLFNYRLLVKHMFSYYRHRMIKNFRVMIFGAGQTGIVTRHVINSTPRMQVLGFIEDNPNKAGKVLDGARIYDGRSAELESILLELNIDELIITVKDITLDRKNELVDLCIRNHIKIRTIPAVEKWVKGELSFNQIKEINIDDLLGRESIKLDNRSVEEDILGKRVMVTGAAGSIGSELVRQVIQLQPSCLIMIDQAESPLYEIEREVKSITGQCQVIPFLADISNKERMEKIFSEFRPDVIYHAAAYKHVPMIESNPSEAVSCNILGTKLLADLAVKYEARKFVMISTDKAVNPTNVMGCSKRIAEVYVQSLNNFLRGKSSSHTVFVTTRFGNVLGSNGSVIPIFKKQIQSGGPITVTHPEITRYFMTIPEACQLVLEAGTMGKGGEIYIFDMGKSVKIMDLAKKMIWLSGLEPGKDIDVVFTGLREGEKLYEELLSNKENTIPTHHEKIMIAKVQQSSYEEFNKYIELFHDLVDDKNELKMVALMKELIPEYKSNYSRYEVLDKLA